MKWSELMANSDAGALRRSVDLVSVADFLGLPLTHDGSEWKTLCLWHDDHNPSLGIFTGSDGVQRVKCHACTFSGDVFDLISKKRGVSFSEALTLVASLKAAGLPEARTPDQGAPVDLDAYASRLRGTADSHGSVLSLLHDRGIDVPLAFVRDEFRVSVDEHGNVVIPHYDERDRVHAVKRRLAGAGWEKKNVRGSRMDALYGQWRDNGRKVVVLAEGESDTWTLAWKYRHEDLDVLGLPSGVAEVPKDSWIDRLRDRDVVLCFDADNAGRLGLRQWIGALGSVANSIRVASVGDGEDASTFDVDEARQITTAPLMLLQGREGYLRRTAEEKPDVPVSDWTVKLERVCVVDEERFVFEVSFPPFGKTTYLSTDDLNATAKLRKWANGRGLAWKGNDGDCQELLRLLQREALFVPRVRGTHVAGLNGSAFVLPDLVIGSKSWAYVPPVADVRLGERIAIAPGTFARQVPSLLTRLHAPDVVTPIIGWCAAATLRATLPNFPVLAVVGGSGWGKTTLVGEVLKTFGFATAPMTITSTTPHAVSALCAATNSIPVWFDEYRFGARVDAKEKLDQKIRDAWDGAASMKGGMRENLQALTAENACAPIIVTGEDAFSETSHAERMVIVPIPRLGRDPRALAELRAADSEGFGFAFLEWIVDGVRKDTIPTAPVELDRMVQARALARWGYDLFRLFAREVCGLELVVEYDESRVLAEHAETGARSPIMEAVSLLLEKPLGEDGMAVAWTDGTDVLVRPEALVRAVKRHTDLVLPGGSRAIGNWLRERFPASTERTTRGRAIRLAGATAEIVLSDE